jgi:protein SCO1/2
MNNFLKTIFAFFIGIVYFSSCSHDHPLPILGNRYAVTKEVNGQLITDSVYQQIPSFSLINQDSQIITNQSVLGKIYVADFFFTSCPTICPVMKKEMIKVYKKYKGNPQVMMLSHTIDPEFDTIALLKDFATRLGADGKQWMFLTGNKDSIYNLAEQGYYATAMPDSTEPGGYVHSGGFILIDKQQRVRGIYDGTNSESVDELLKDMDILLKE